ncbi:MAG: transcription termination/antitermination protein NusG [candidate division WOR-3 bacterium]
MRKWYAFRTQAGRESTVKELFERLRVENALEHKIVRVLVPTQTIPRVKKGKRLLEEKPLFKGYVLVEIEQESDEDPAVGEILELLSSTGLARPILAKEKDRKEIKYTFLTLTDQEVSEILETQEREREKKEQEVPFLAGEMIKVVEGPFAGMEGEIKEIFPERGKMKVEITFFGRVTSVVLDFIQVERAGGR